MISKQIDDVRGSLNVLNLNDLPFIPKRIFTLFNLNEKERGKHYHKITEEYLVIIKGNCILEIEDKNTGKNKIIEGTIGTELYLPIMHKITIKDSSIDCVINVFCNELYDATDAYYD